MAYVKKNATNPTLQRGEKAEWQKKLHETGKQIEEYMQKKEIKSLKNLRKMIIISNGNRVKMHVL